MTNNNSETSDDRSPFDFHKNFYYEAINDYHKKKNEQLISIKNFDLASKELEGFLGFAKRTNDKELITATESKLSEVNSLLAKRNQERTNLATKYNLFKNAKTEESLKDLEVTFNNFKAKASENEEYGNLINELTKDLVFNNANTEKVKEELESILTFEPLKYLVEISKLEMQKNKKSFLLFDLDSTLFDNSPRVYKIIQEFIKEHKDQYPDDIEKMLKIQRKDIIWGIRENVKKFDIHNDELITKLIQYWFNRFFSNDYIIDKPLRGSSKFIKELQDTGIKIVYLTGRFESMREGTEKNILEHNFPLDKDGSNLVLKPDPKMEDHTFKHQAMEEMRKFGNMIAGFDNEPINTNIFKEHFKESNIFFLETNHSPNPPNLLDDIYTLFNFEY